MVSFGLITEGITDQIVIENVLYGYFGESIDVNFIQPERDETGKNRILGYAGWHKVFEFCSSGSIPDALSFNDYLIIQIDTDTCEDVGYGVPRKLDGVDLSPEELLSKVTQKIQDKIGEAIFNEYSERIIFAVTVDSIECWLLPLFYDDNKREKWINCLDKLNYILNRRLGCTIDPHNKNVDYYEKISSEYRKKRTLSNMYKHNPSFKVFIEEIKSRKITI